MFSPCRSSTSVNGVMVMASSSRKITAGVALQAAMRSVQSHRSRPPARISARLRRKPWEWRWWLRRGPKQWPNRFPLTVGSWQHRATARPIQRLNGLRSPVSRTQSSSRRLRLNTVIIPAPPAGSRPAAGPAPTTVMPGQILEAFSWGIRRAVTGDDLRSAQKVVEEPSGEHHARLKHAARRSMACGPLDAVALTTVRIRPALTRLIRSRAVPGGIPGAGAGWRRRG